MMLAIWDKYTKLANPLVVSDDSGGWKELTLEDLASAIAEALRESTGGKR